MATRSSLPAAALALIFVCLAGIHVYWMAGGRAGAGVAIPTVAGRPLFRPSRLATAAVALALFVAATLALVAALGLAAGPVARLLGCAHFVIAAIFLARAIGNFRTLGLFKKVSGTPFATWDTCLYVPLSLGICALSFWVAFVYSFDR